MSCTKESMSRRSKTVLASNCDAFVSQRVIFLYWNFSWTLFRSKFSGRSSNLRSFPTQEEYLKPFPGQRVEGGLVAWAPEDGETRARGSVKGKSGVRGVCKGVKSAGRAYSYWDVSLYLYPYREDPRRHGDRIDLPRPQRYVRNDSQLANSIPGALMRVGCWLPRTTPSCSRSSISPSHTVPPVSLACAIAGCNRCNRVLLACRSRQPRLCSTSRWMRTTMLRILACVMARSLLFGLHIGLRLFNPLRLDFSLELLDLVRVPCSDRGNE